MFRKKLPPSSGRNVRRSPSAPVFSYYARRTPAEPVAPPRRTLPRPHDALGISWRGRLKYLPSLVAIVASLGCGVYLTTLSTKPQIQVVDADDSRLLRGTDTYEKEAEAVLSASLFNRSKLLIDTAKVARELQQAFPELGEVSVVLPLMSRRPIVEVRPASPAVLLGAPGGSFIIDETGRAIATASEVGSALRDSLPAVQDHSDLPIQRGKTVLPGETVAFITTVMQQLHSKGMKPETLLLPAAASELHVRFEGKPYLVKFDVRGEGREQVGTYLAVHARLAKEQKTPGEYIDVRVPEKAFYK